MMRKLFFVLIPVALVALALWLVVEIFNGPGKASAPHLVEKGGRNLPMRIEGFGFSTYEGDRLATRLMADELRVNPRKFFIFRMKSVNEVTLVKARFEIHFNPNEPEGQGGLLPLGELSSQTRGLWGSQDMGRITRAVIEGLQIDLFRAQNGQMRVKAQKGMMDFKKKQTHMDSAVLEDIPSGKKIFSKKIIWDENAKLFKIPGKYQAQTPRGRAAGEGITVDLNFRVKRLSFVSGQPS